MGHNGRSKMVDLRGIRGFLMVVAGMNLGGFKDILVEQYLLETAVMEQLVIHSYLEVVIKGRLGTFSKMSKQFLLKIP